jgi:BCL2/adenovirus E1B protein-interacting protein 3
LANADDELKGIFINKESEGAKEWVLNYLTARCDSQAKTKLVQRKANLSLRNTKFAGKSLFSKEVMYTLFISNFLSLILGAGIGLWLSKRSTGLSQYTLN